MGEIKFRHETKHEIRYSEYLFIRNRLRAIASQDRNVRKDGTYFIRSLYFDNYRDKALREKIDGVNQREKFRIRFYNGDPSIIHLEKKSKVNGLCNKLSASIKKDEVERLLDGDILFLTKSRKSLFLELYAKIKAEQLSPRVIVDYTREPYIYEAGNVRITFDTNIRTGLYSQKFFDMEIPTISAILEDHVLMEVKYDAYLPEVIKLCIQLGERAGEAFSKYAACRRFG